MSPKEGDITNLDFHFFEKLTPTKCLPSRKTIIILLSSCSTKLALPGKNAGIYPKGTPDIGTDGLP